MVTVHVCLPLPIPKLFTYLAPLALSKGDVVLVPFGKRHFWGIVWQCDMSNPTTLVSSIALKDIIRVHPFLKVHPRFISFLESMAAYTLSPLGNILKMTLPEVHKDRLLLLRPFPFLRGKTGLYWSGTLFNQLIQLLPEPPEDIWETLSPLSEEKKAILALLSDLPLSPLKKLALDAPVIPFLSWHWTQAAFQRFYNLHQKISPALGQALEEAAHVKAPPSFWQNYLSVSWAQIKKLIYQGALLPVTEVYSQSSSDLFLDSHIPPTREQKPLSSSEAISENLCEKSLLHEHNSHPHNPSLLAHSKNLFTISAKAPLILSLDQKEACQSICDPKNLFTISAKAPLILSLDQDKAYKEVRNVFSASSFAPVLLEGVTGSGKTEVALSLCQDVWAKGQQVLVLLPEIALSSQWARRSENYFQCHSETSSTLCSENSLFPLSGLWHSALSPSVRQQTFEGLTQGTLPLIIGARSALCLPYHNLGLIIVDEEHDINYKQTEGVLYHGRDMAINRAFHEKIPILLLSATPSLEVLKHVHDKKYTHIQLTSRYGAAQLPSLHLVDRRSHPPKEGAWISPVLRQALEETLARNEQSLLFLNRRGFASLLICFQCGWREECPHCSVWLSVHAHKEKKLICHYCGFAKPVPTECTQCHQGHALTAMGVGIEKIQQEVLSFMPEARVALFSSDHMTSSEVMSRTLTQIVQGDIDIIIGTQILAKGHHFPQLSCIGIVDADAALENIDFRSRERLFQLLQQVSGRAGRSTTKGHAYLQTLFPEDQFFSHLLSHQKDLFVSHELERRHQENLPPFTRFALITLSGLCDLQVQETAFTLQKYMKPPEEVTVWGPAPAPLSPLRNRHRWRFILKAPRSFSIQKWIHHWISSIPSLSKSVHIETDIDPYHFL
jgi:primosomal protein N' (replication factor Y)